MLLWIRGYLSALLSADSQFPGCPVRCRDTCPNGWLPLSWLGPPRHQQRLSSQVSDSDLESDERQASHRWLKVSLLCFFPLQDRFCSGFALRDVRHPRTPSLQPCRHDPTKWGQEVQVLQLNCLYSLLTEIWKRYLEKPMNSCLSTCWVSTRLSFGTEPD